jgi:hypothetical protein
MDNTLPATITLQTSVELVEQLGLAMNQYRWLLLLVHMFSAFLILIPHYYVYYQNQVYCNIWCLLPEMPSEPAT